MSQGDHDMAVGLFIFHYIHSTACVDRTQAGISQCVEIGAAWLYNAGIMVHGSLGMSSPTLL